MNLKIFAWLALTLLGMVQYNDGAKILAIFPFPGLSQYILVLPYLKELAKRGHEVSVITAFPQKEEIPNFRDIPALKIHEVYEHFQLQTDFTSSKWSQLRVYDKYLELINNFVFESTAVQKLMHSNETFDLVIAETISLEPLYGFAQHFNAILMGISSYGTDRNIDELVGNISPVSYLPQNDIGFTEHMSFWERLQNLYSVTLEFLYMRMFYYPKQEKLYKAQFPNAKISMMELRRNFSLVLLNQHFSTGAARPYVPNMIPVGGFHIQHNPSPLLEDVLKFIESYPQGVVYFSFGSNVKSKDLPKPVLKVLLETFAKLKQGVLWKFESLDLPDKPKNVLISKWFQQAHVLTHPNVKLFVTHGGLLSTIEAVYHGKPLIGIPLFYDQFNNVRRAVEKGYALQLDIKTLTADALSTAIERILNEPTFTAKAKKLSQLYHDQPMPPMDMAIYWTEYILRHKGAPHMRVAAQDLNFLQLHSLDTMAVLYGGTLLLVFLCLSVLRRLICLCCCKRRETRKQKLN